MKKRGYPKDRARPPEFGDLLSTVKTGQHLSQLNIAGLRQSHRSKSPLTEEDAQEIRQRLRDGELGKDLAEEYGVSRSLISRIKNGSRWY